MTEIVIISLLAFSLVGSLVLAYHLNVEYNSRQELLVDNKRLRSQISTLESELDTVKNAVRVERGIRSVEALSDKALSAIIGDRDVG
jgi:hypothetical protein